MARMCGRPFPPDLEPQSNSRSHPPSFIPALNFSRSDVFETIQFPLILWKTYFWLFHLFPPSWMCYVVLAGCPSPAAYEMTGLEGCHGFAARVRLIVYEIITITSILPFILFRFTSKSNHTSIHHLAMMREGVSAGRLAAPHSLLLPTLSYNQAWTLHWTANIVKIEFS